MRPPTESGRTGREAGPAPGIELTFVIKENQDTTDKMIFLGKKTIMRACGRAHEWENRSGTPRFSFRRAAAALGWM
jgi:hypothetical protein